MTARPEAIAVTGAAMAYGYRGRTVTIASVGSETARSIAPSGSVTLTEATRRTSDLPMTRSYVPALDECQRAGTRK
jgi:hypothetical protein